MYSRLVFDLFSHLVNLDGKVTNQEIDFINTQLKKGYSSQESETYFNLFLEALNSKLSIDKIAEDINSEYRDDYMGKIDIIISAYELISADTIDNSELLEFNRICSMFKIDDRHRDLISSVLIDSYDYNYIENVGNKITLGPDPLEYDLIYESCNLEIININDCYYLINKLSTNSIYIGDREILNRKIERLSGGDSIYIGDRKIFVNDLSWIFSQNISKSIYFAVNESSLQQKFSMGEADFTLELDNKISRLAVNSRSKNKFSIGSYVVDNIFYINASDTLTINNKYRIKCQKLIEGCDLKKLNLSSFESTVKDIIVSTDSSKADIHIQSETISSFEISISIVKEGENSNFTITPVEIDRDRYIDGKLLKKGELLSINRSTSFTIGNLQIELNTILGEVLSSRIHFSTFVVNNLTYKFSDGSTGIDNISFRASKGELIALMGASGAGKSTLLQVLLGYNKPQEGEVLVNGHNFHNNFDFIKNYIGFVPQDDLLFENLTVYENLYYTSKIRLPELGKNQREFLIENVLKDIGLFDKKGLKVGNPVEKVLSGGQRKRLNIGMELISSPDLFFLDEPTSGLSSKDSEMILKLLSRLRDSGKIIFVVIHQPSSELYKIFDKLLLLDVGGKLAYFGNNLEAINYFKNIEAVKDSFIECPSCKKVDPEIIFDILERKELDRNGLPVFSEIINWGKGFEKIIRKMFKRPEVKLIPKRRYDSNFWKRLFLTKKSEIAETYSNTPGELPEKNRLGIRGKILTTSTLIQRSIKEKLNDKMNLVLTFLAPVILSFTLSFILKGNSRPYEFYRNSEFSKFIFITVIIFIFFGLMASVNEVIKDRPTLLREKILNIKPYQYLISKITTFSMFAILQVSIYTIISFTILKIPSSISEVFDGIATPSYLLYFLLMGFVVTYSAFSLGLLVSSLIKSQMLAFNMVTLIIIPQIVLGGLFVSYRDMGKILNKHIPIYANLTLSRWGYEGLLSGSEVFNPLFQVIDSDSLNSHREKFESKGISWDYKKVIDDPINFLKNNLSQEIPGVISKDIFNDFKKDTREQLSDFYIEDRESDNYILNRDDPDIEEVNAIFLSIKPYPFLSRFNELHWNINVQEEFSLNNSMDWVTTKNRREKEMTSELKDWVVDINIFPAHDKVFGIYLFKTVWFNLIILLLMILICHLMTIWRIKKI